MSNKAIETPDLMWKLFEEYQTKTKNNPFKVHDFVGKDGDSVERRKERPLTMEGFECFVVDKGIINYPDLTNYFENKDNGYKDYLPICMRIKRAIRRDQIEGGMVGIYNPSITQRLNNLTEKTESDQKQEVTVNVKYERKANTDNAE